MSIRSDAEWVIAALGQPNAERPDTRRAMYARVDPLLRARVRRRVESLVTDAALSTLYPLDEGHLHRVALLGMRGRSAVLEGVLDVEQLFAEELARRPARGPSRHVATGLALGLLLLALSFGAARTFGPDHWFDPTLLPVNPRAFQEGGRPDPGDAAVRALFVDTMPAYVIALDRAEPSGPTPALDDAERRLLAETLTVLGSEAHTRLIDVLERSRALHAAKEFSAFDDYLRAVDAFNAALERRGVGYYLDAELMAGPNGGRLYVASFAVERVRYYGAEGRSLRALRLSRRDSLNFVRGVLGFTRPHLRDALVLTERVDTWLAQRAIAGLSLDGRLALMDDDAAKRAPPAFAALEARGARVAHAELAKLAPGCKSLADTSALFARRRAVFRALSEQARARGMWVQEPLGYDVDAGHFETLRPVLDVATYDELRRVAWDLDDDAHRACFRALREPLLTSVERHEIQHRLDYAAGLPTQLPAAFEQRSGPLARYGLRDEGAERALAETSAYLSELARGRELAKLNLAMLAQFVLDRSRWSSAEYVAALLIFDGLVRELGLTALDPSDAPPTSRVVSALDQLFARDEAELSRAAGSLWQKLMGRPLPQLTVTRE